MSKFTSYSPYCWCTTYPCKSGHNGVACA